MRLAFIKKDIKLILKTYLRKKKLNLDRNKKYVFIMLAPDYSNAGDTAIEKAQEKFLKDNFSEYEIVIIKNSDTVFYINEIKHLKKNNSIITLIGGGNNGSLYEFIEENRRLILRELRKKIIVSFPQSVFYAHDNEGIYLKKKFYRLINKCKNITLIAREKQSYIEYRNNTNKRVLLTPDIVFYLENTHHKKDDIISIICRSDKEKNGTVDIKSELVKELSPNYKIDVYDTVEDNKNEYNIFYENIIKRIGKSKLVITDRLHGMILAYISNVKCIVTNNNNNKIGSTYETWLKNNKNIIYYKDSLSLINNINSIELFENRTINNKKYKKEFNEIKDAIRSEINGKH